MVPFPGIGAIILIPKAERLNAISSSKFLIFDIFTPASGTISYNVTVGPMVALILAISILKFLRVSIILFLFEVNSSFETCIF